VPSEAFKRQHFLYLSPLPHRHGSFLDMRDSGILKAMTLPLILR
jgi:hypothetical protein